MGSNHVCSGIEFGSVMHLAGKRPTVVHSGEWRQVPPANANQGQRFQVLELNKYFSTPFLLHIEADGFPVNFQLWNSAFLGYDYIGAPWQKRGLETGINRVGNGGCSLQSKKFRNFIDAHAHLYREGTLSNVFFCQELYSQAVAARIHSIKNVAPQNSHKSLLGETLLFKIPTPLETGDFLLPTGGCFRRKKAIKKSSAFSKNRFHENRGAED